MQYVFFKKWHSLRLSGDFLLLKDIQILYRDYKNSPSESGLTQYNKMYVRIFIPLKRASRISYLPAKPYVILTTLPLHFCHPSCLILTDFILFIRPVLQSRSHLMVKQNPHVPTVNDIPWTILAFQYNVPLPEFLFLKFLWPTNCQEQFSGPN